MAAVLDSTAHLTAIKTALASLPYPVSLTFAPAAGQYVVLSAPSWRSPDDQRLAPGDTALELDVRVTAVTGTVEGVGVMLRDIRTALTPGLVPTRLPVAGWDAWLSWTRSEVVAVDESSTNTGTSRHPAYGVETYHLTAEPTS